MNINLRYERTGEIRPPLTGEWFEAENGNPIQARFDFAMQRFRILRAVVEVKEGEKP